MREPVHADPAVPPTGVDPPGWHARWASWPGDAEPLLLLAGPGRLYTGSGYSEDQADAWYCAKSLRLVAWTGGPLEIPQLTFLTVHVGGPELRLRVVGRPWLTPDTGACGPDDFWAAAHRGHTLLGVIFTGRRSAPPTLRDFLPRLLAGAALIGDVPVIGEDDEQVTQ